MRFPLHGRLMLPQHSRRSDLWATPPSFFKLLDDRFHFSLDAAAGAGNAKCDDYYSANDDGLVQPWRTWTWCNPPYSNILGWYEKAHLEALKGNSSVVLTFARTDTKAFHEHVKFASEVIFVRGRLKFIDPRTGSLAQNAPAPSMVVVFEAGKLGNPIFSTMQRS